MIYSRLFFLLLAIQCIYADLWIVDNDDHKPEITNKPLFISLGSNCVPAGILRSCGLREAAYPFDWMISLDNDGLIKAIGENLHDFLNEECLLPDNFLRQNASGAALIHMDYRFEFVHEGDFFGAEYLANMRGFKERYQRRIDRFNRIADAQGTVIFLRCNNKEGPEDRHRYFKSEAILDISDEDSIKLYRALKEKFPAIKLKLIVMNEREFFSHGIEVERVLNSDIIKVNHCFPSQEIMFAEFGKFLIREFCEKESG